MYAYKSNANNYYESRQKGYEEGDENRRRARATRGAIVAVPCAQQTFLTQNQKEAFTC